ncbi:c-type cytochrome [Bartonella sp. LJL80]
MKPYLMSLAAILALSGSAFAQDSQDKIAHGEYIARASDCVACHTADVAKPFAGGYAVGTPFGTVYSANISSSKQYGIGNWSEAEFAKAVRDGISKTKGRLYPAMPYDAYHAMTDDDASALYAYLQTTKPIDEAAPKTELSFPFNIRLLMIGWNLFNMRSGSNHAAGESDIDRGRYLVDVLGHCGTCHTPRNFMMGLDTSKHLAGSSAGGWHAPNITPDKISGIGSWTDEQIIAYLHTGKVVGKGSAAGDMAEAVEDSTQYFTDADLQAVVKYLRSLTPVADPAQKQSRSDYGEPVAADYALFGKTDQAFFAAVENKELNVETAITGNASDTSTTDGAVLFNNACASCHQPSGSGVAGNYYPALFHNSAVGAADPSNLVLTILNGVSRHTGQVDAFMPAYNKDMDDTQIASLANYVLQNWGNPDAKVNKSQVSDLRKMKPNYSATPLLMLFWGGMAVAIIVLLAVIFYIKKRSRVES